MKEIIIIPGACSSESNWFDQIEYFNSHGYKVYFLDLLACDCKDMKTCAEQLLIRLEKIFVESKEAKFIYAHSMGGMLLLKVLFQPELFPNFSKEFLHKLFSSQIVFIQPPLQMRTLPYFMYVQGRPLILTFVFIHRHLVYFWFNALLVRLKKNIAPVKRHSIILVILDLFLNLGLMFNSCAGTRVEEFYNLIEYYKEWKNFDFEKCISEEIQHTNFKNFYFTCGSPDSFENRTKLEKLVKILGARIFKMPLGFHSPQHFFWWQTKLMEPLLHCNGTVTAVHMNHFTSNRT